MASTPTAGSEQPDSALRAMRVLEALAGMEQPAGLLTIAAAVNLSKTRAYRVLRSLQDHGYVDHADRNGYRIGSRSLALASLIGPRPALLQRARPVLAKLVGVASESATLHLRSGAHRVLVLGVEARNNVLHRSVMVGERAPLTSGCSGTTILAHLPSSEADEIIKVHTKSKQRPALAALLHQIRDDGFALSFSSNHVGLNGIAAPLLDPEDGYPLGSVAIAGAEQRLPEAALRRLARPLSAACAELAPRLATVLGPNSSVRLESLDVTIQDFLEA